MKGKTVKVALEMIGPMRLPPSGKIFRGEFSSGVTVRELLAAAGYSAAEMQALLVIRGNRHLGLEEKVTSNARLKVFLRLGGG